eukprot:scaffold171_cov229-Prasinococcus_capsulatus_cf.AAC.4
MQATKQPHAPPRSSVSCAPRRRRRRRRVRGERARKQARQASQRNAAQRRRAAGAHPDVAAALRRLRAGVLLDARALALLRAALQVLRAPAHHVPPVLRVLLLLRSPAAAAVELGARTHASGRASKRARRRWWWWRR